MPVFEDAFTRADENLDVSADWTDDTGASFSYKIVSNEVKVIAANAGQFSAWVNSISTRANMIVVATVRLGTNQPAVGVMGRRTANDTYYSAELSQIGRVLQIRLLNAGVSSLLVGGAEVHDTGTNYLLTFTVDGTALSASTSLEALSTTNGTITAAGSGGIIAYSATADHPAFMDAFSIDDTTQAAGPSPSAPVFPVGPPGGFFEVPATPYGSYKSHLALHDLFNRARLG